MSFVPTLRRVDIEGNPTTSDDYLQEVSAGTFIAFRELLLQGEDRDITLQEYKCYVVLMSAHEGGRPHLHHMLWKAVYKGTDLVPLDSTDWYAPIGKLLKYITAEQFFAAVTYFKDVTPNDWINKAFDAIQRVAPFSPEAENSLKNE